MMIPPDGVKRKLNGVVDSVPPDKCCEVLNGGVNDEEWDKSDKEMLLIVMMVTFW